MADEPNLIRRAAAGADPSDADAQDDLAALIARAQKSSRGLPPVEKWNPEHSADIGMRIDAEGRWFYQDSEIKRPALVRLFSTVLRKDEDGQTFMVTPVEKVLVEVEDAHFLAVECVRSTNDAGEEILTFRTNVGEVIEAGPDHELRFEGQDGKSPLKPYLEVRGRLVALASRAVTHQLVDLGEQVTVDGREVYAVRSNGETFPMMAMETLRGQLD